MQVGEEDEALRAAARYSALDRLLHLEQQLGVVPHVVDEPMRAPTASYAASAKALPTPAPLSIEHVVPALDQLARPGRRQRDAVLVGLDLFCDADLHRARTLPPRRKSDTHSTQRRHRAAVTIAAGGGLGVPRERRVKVTAAQVEQHGGEGFGVLELAQARR